LKANIGATDLFSVHSGSPSQGNYTNMGGESTEFLESVQVVHPLARTMPRKSNTKN